MAPANDNDQHPPVCPIAMKAAAKCVRYLVEREETDFCAAFESLSAVARAWFEQEVETKNLRRFLVREESR